MKKRLKIDFLKTGAENENLTKIVASHNGGKCPVSLDDIASWLWCERGRWPSVNLEADKYAKREETEPNKLFITEDGGKTFTCIIEEIEVNELADDLNGLFTSTKEEKEEVI